MNKTYGYVRVAASVPELKVANVEFNTEEVIKEIKSLNKEGVQIVTFPELCLTGYTCADLFSQDILITKSKEAIRNVMDATKSLDIISIIGAPIVCDNQLFNCAVVINKGEILGIVPKTYIPNYGEFYEKRWFSTSNTLTSRVIKLFGRDVPIGTDLIFRDREDDKFTFGIEVCEDLWSPKAPSVEAALNGATMIFNLSASNEVIGKYGYRKNLINMQSAKNVCAYIYSSSGVNESTTDLVFSGYAAIAENGSTLVENNRFDFETNHIISDVDIQRLMNNRIKDISFMGIGASSNYRV
ncbi:MAG: NAD(+) synthase, partial [Bacilli bacterium]|nr:NAD(+) synthase [Bacilli bacterium]